MKAPLYRVAQDTARAITSLSEVQRNLESIVAALPPEHVDLTMLVIDLRGEREVMRRLLDECHKLLDDLLQTEDDSETCYRLRTLGEQIAKAISKIYAPSDARLRARPSAEETAA